MASGSAKEYSAIKWKTYTSFGADINLFSDAPGGANLSQQRPCRRIRFGSSGAVVLKDADGNSDTCSNVQAGEQWDIQAGTIVASGTTITSCTVFW